MILTVSNLLVKTAGLLFKIPMNYIIGDTGMGYYNSAYSVYTFFYMLSTSGLPVALSVMVSEHRSRGNIRGAKTVYRIALAIFALIGLSVFALMFFFSDILCDIIKSDKSTAALMMIAPTMLFICISSAYRGYFQGCGNMTPTAVSQLIEAVMKLIFGIAAASYAIRRGYTVEIVAAYAVSGLTLGALAGAVYLAVYKMIRKDSDLRACDILTRNEKIATPSVLRRFIKISFPVTVSASVMSLTNMVDTVLIQRMLVHSGMTEEMGATLFGNYTSLAVPMFNLPPVLVYPIAYSLVPVVAAAFASGEREKAQTAIEASLRCAVIIGLPCALGLSVLSEPILCLFYKESSALLAAPLLTCLAPSSFFVCILAVTNSVLQGSGKERLPVISMLAGALVKLITSILLLDRYGIMGAPISTFLCYLTVTVLNFMFVVKACGIGMCFKKTFLTPLISGVLCAFVAFYSNTLFIAVLDSRIACLLAVMMAAAVYAVALFVTRAVSLDEIKSLIGKRSGSNLPIGKENKNDRIGIRTEKQVENRKNARLRLTSRACEGASLARGMRVGYGTDAQIYSRRHH